MMILMTETEKTARMTASHQKRGLPKTRLAVGIVAMLMRHSCNVSMAVAINVTLTLTLVVKTGEEADGHTQQGAADGLCLL